MKTVLHKSETRGHANHGWLNAKHSFSFASYYDPERIQFGMLRVLNDDTVAAGTGFGKHPHDNMEIVTIVMKGALEHQDSMGHAQVINAGEVQIMSAGSGVYHSEKNHSSKEPVELFQIWVLPDEMNIEPRYDQKAYSKEDRKNQWQTVVSPNHEGALWINQEAYFSLLELDGEKEYQLNDPSHGAYVFMIEGETTIGDIPLQRRDALGISEIDRFTIRSNKPSSVLVIEVPMN